MTVTKPVKCYKAANGGIWKSNIPGANNISGKKYTTILAIPLDLVKTFSQLKKPSTAQKINELIDGVLFGSISTGVVSKAAVILGVSNPIALIALGIVTAAGSTMALSQYYSWDFDEINELMVGETKKGLLVKYYVHYGNGFPTLNLEYSKYDTYLCDPSKNNTGDFTEGITQELLVKWAKKGKDSY